MKNIKNFFINNNLETDAKLFLLAVSGGPDSMAMVDLMRHSVKDPSNQLIVGHFDHQLRPDSYKESELLKDYCKRHNLCLIEKKWDKSQQPDSGIEAAARKYRYKFLEGIVKEKKVDYLLTAHHGDDLIENILLKLLRSGNIQEMNSLVQVGPFRQTSAYLLRPLLQYSKNELLAYVKEKHLSYIVDSTNMEDDTLRNRLRHHVVPLLKADSNDLISNANRFQESEAELAASQETFFASLPAPTKKFGTWSGNLKDLQVLDLKQEKLYFEWLSLKKFHQRVHLKKLGTKPNFHTRKDGIELIIYQHKYYLYRANELNNEQIKPFKIELDKAFTFKGKTYIISRQNLSFKKNGEFYEKEDLELVAGSLPPGQKLKLLENKETKARKKFAESGIPAILRPICLTIMTKQNDALEVQFIAGVYRKQNYSSKYVQYIIYEI